MTNQVLGRAQRPGRTSPPQKLLDFVTRMKFRFFGKYGHNHKNIDL